jgi:hypothetical protein
MRSVGFWMMGGLGVVLSSRVIGAHKEPPQSPPPKRKRKTHGQAHALNEDDHSFKETK